VRYFPIVIIAVMGLTACSDEAGKNAQTPQGQTQQVQVIRHQDSAQIQRGHALFSQNCASCHGLNAQGAPNWSRPGVQGKDAAPPLNGTGHAWHHPMKALLTTIKYGTARLGGSMPAWQGKLSDQDINDIVAWFQSQWPDDIYAAWQRMDHMAQQGNK